MNYQLRIIIVSSIIFCLFFQFKATANTISLWDEPFSQDSLFTLTPTSEEKEEEKQQKSPILGALMSFFIPGLGQIYAQEYGKGAAIMGGVIGIITAYLLIDSIRPKKEPLDGRLETLTLTLQLGGISFWLWNFTDAFKIIQKQNDELEGKKDVQPQPQ